MFKLKDRWFIFIVVIGVILLTTLPYLYAIKSAGEDYVFSGFLLNPLDGNSYVAKMYQGWRGDLLFTLPYTAEKGNGAFLFIFYLLLGHLSRLIGLELLWTFHLARVIGGIFLLVILYKFFARSIPDVITHRFAYLLVVLGAGVGWLAIPFGILTSDFWVAEAYPFLSVYVNPHFPFGLGLLLIIVVPGIIKVRQPGDYIRLKEGATLVILSVVLAIVQPFGVVLAIAILGGMAFLEVYPHLSRMFQSVSFQRLGWVILGSCPFVIYEVWVINSDPLLSIWNAQNQTPSPPIWDFVLSLSPVLILALLGILVLLKEKSISYRLAIVWAVLGMLLLYVPWSLQRRFMMGLYIPLVLLVFMWLESKKLQRRQFIFTISIILFLSLPTNLLVLLTGRHGAQTQDPALYLGSSEVDAFDWIETHTTQDALILSAPQTGLFIPAHTGRRVIYGHPFETVNAEEMKALVTRYFMGESTNADMNMIQEVDYIFVGPRELQIGGVNIVEEYPIVYQNPDVTIYGMSR